MFYFFLFLVTFAKNWYWNLNYICEAFIQIYIFSRSQFTRSSDRQNNEVRKSFICICATLPLSEWVIGQLHVVLCITMKERIKYELLQHWLKVTYDEFSSAQTAAGLITADCSGVLMTPQQHLVPESLRLWSFKHSVIQLCLKYM